jgi:hypothetical protein
MNMTDVMTETKLGYSMVDNEYNRLSGGLKYILSLVKLASPERSLLKPGDEWRRDRVLEYLEQKRRFLELLMHLTGGQQGRGPELGSIKFRNSILSSRNIFVHEGMVFYSTEYHKARAGTNLSHHVAMFLPSEVGDLVVIYLAYIRPFANLIFNQIAIVKNRTDGDYLFSDESKVEGCWEGKQLSKALASQSSRFLKCRLTIWSYRQLAVAITKRHIKEIAIFFGVEDKEGMKEYKRQKEGDVYAWQAGHIWSTNDRRYGLDMAYPSELQPSLLDEYRRISCRWHGWLGFEQKKTEVRQQEWDEEGPGS